MSASATRVGVVLAATLVAGCTNLGVYQAPPGSRPIAGAGVHVVRPGDTLDKIAFQYGLRDADLARWNELRDPDVIRVGQRLRLTPPAARAAAAPAVPSAPPARGTGVPAAVPASVPAPVPRSAPGSVPAPVPRVPPSAAPATSRAALPTPSPSEAPAAWLWPTQGGVVMRFGSTGGIATGIGIGGRLGQPVVAAGSGRVVYAGDGLVGYGQLIIVKHSETFLTAYGHLSRVLVAEGQDIARGQAIAELGVGPGREPRLHFEVRRNGTPVDPLLLMAAPR